jgi:hypothetical protein
VREGLYNYAEDEGAPTEIVVERTRGLLNILTEEQRKEVQRGDVTNDEI